MKLETTRRIDRYAGIPLCAALSALRRAARVLSRRRPLPPMRRVLFIKLSEQGATVLANGALHRAAALTGRENLFFCVFEKNREILDLLNIVPRENVLTVRDGSLIQFGADMLRALWRMRRERIDTTIDMELFARVSAVIAFLSGARRRAGLHKFANEGLYRGDLLTHRVQYNPYHHVSMHYDVLLAAAQRDPGEIPLPKFVPARQPYCLPRFEAPAADRAKIEALLREQGVGTDRFPLIVFNPKAGDIMPIRRWPPERFVELGRRLVGAHPGAVLVFTGLPAEREAVEDLCRGIGAERTVNLAGDLNLRELIGLLSLADVLVTSDSGPAHFASLTDADIVVLFGSETPALYGPLGERVHAIYKRLACSPCLSAANMRVSFCKDNQCMQLITVDEVLETVNRCVATRRAARAGTSCTGQGAAAPEKESPPA